MVRRGAKGTGFSRRRFMAGAVAAATLLMPSVASASKVTPANRIVPIRPRPEPGAVTQEPHLGSAAAGSQVAVGGGAGGKSRRTLAFYHAHTRQSLNITYYENGRYLPNALRKINHFMRDYRANQVKEIDAGLLDVLYELQARLHVRQPYMLLSAYRSPSTNASLRKTSAGVAKNSLHMVGKAVDIRVKDVAIGKVAQEAIAMKKGGVGFYRRRNYVHVDVGDVRTWRG